MPKLADLIRDLVPAPASAATATAPPIQRPGEVATTATWLQFGQPSSYKCSHVATVATPKAVEIEVRIAEWMIQNPVVSPPGHCLACGSGETLEPLLPFGTGSTGHAWLHLPCWPAWHAKRREEAIAILTSSGVATTATWLHFLRPSQTKCSHVATVASAETPESVEDRNSLARANQLREWHIDLRGFDCVKVRRLVGRVSVQDDAEA